MTSTEIKVEGNNGLKFITKSGRELRNGMQVFLMYVVPPENAFARDGLKKFLGKIAINGAAWAIIKNVQVNTFVNMERRESQDFSEPEFERVEYSTVSFDAEMQNGTKHGVGRINSSNLWLVLESSIPE